jgi:hypothetical protein
MSAPVDLVPSIHAIAKTAVTDVTSTCLTLIGRAQRDLVSQFMAGRPKWLYRTVSINTVDGTQDYDLEALIPAAVAGVTMDDRHLIAIRPPYRSTPLEHVELGYMIEQDPDGTTGTNKPTRWAWTGATSTQEIRLQPTPDSVYALQIEFFRQMTYVTSADTGSGVVLDWPTDYEEVLIQHAAMMARKDARRIVTATMQQDHDRRVAQLIATQHWTPPRGHRHLRPKGPSRRFRRFVQS